MMAAGKARWPELGLCCNKSYINSTHNGHQIADPIAVEQKIIKIHGPCTG